MKVRMEPEMSLTLLVSRVYTVRDNGSKTRRNVKQKSWKETKWSGFSEDTIISLKILRDSNSQNIKTLRLFSKVASYEMHLKKTAFQYSNNNQLGFFLFFNREGLLQDQAWRTGINVVVEWPGCVRRFLTPWTATHSTPLSSTISHVCTNSHPLSQWCSLTILSSAGQFTSGLQSFPVSGSFPMRWLFASGGQRTGASVPASVLPMNIQGWFPLRLTGLIF